MNNCYHQCFHQCCHRCYRHCYNNNNEVTNELIDKIDPLTISNSVTDYKIVESLNYIFFKYKSFNIIGGTKKIGTVSDKIYLTLDILWDKLYRLSSYGLSPCYITLYQSTIPADTKFALRYHNMWLYTIEPCVLEEKLTTYQNAYLMDTSLLYHYGTINVKTNKFTPKIPPGGFNKPLVNHV